MPPTTLSDRATHMNMIPPPASSPSSHGKDFVEVVVVRHGETSANTLRIIQGQMDVELNETGRQQAVMVARRLSREAKPSAVYSSDLKRAAETAQTIATACNVSNLVLNPALRERHMGDLHGLKFDDAIRSKPDAWKAFSSDDRSQEIPGVGRALINCLSAASIEELCWHADHPTNSARRRIPNTSICIFHISATNGHWTLERFGDIAHLNEDGFLQHAFGGDGASA
uniref:Phosphoglycerate mutase-like protein n=1 Tax=Leersia perrieri TaxID=77586 RepID=A0A0D9XNW2_9ORYZ